MALATAPLLCIPSLAQPWAERHRRRAGALLGQPVEPRPRATRHNLVWLVTHVVTGLPASAFCPALLGQPVSHSRHHGAVVGLSHGAVAARGQRSDHRLGRRVVARPGESRVPGGTGRHLPPLFARAHAWCCLAVLAPSPAEQLVERVTELTRTRTDVLQAHSAELRRIERDLHDGTQARLVAIAMRLAVAGESFSDDPDAAAVLVRQAHAETEDTMTEQRSVIRTIYPPGAG
ncbi:histidine kinase [Streptomyces sp. NPDC056831]|uniref:histidine kinase n=1 Tax=Streptomyces sp. NPDC056831 TaxID=3345954 RepID=UPI0036A2C543